MKILVVGNGGREHALVWKLARETGVRKVYAAPGNGGTGESAENVPIRATDIAALRAFAKKTQIDLTVVGPEDPLALGIVDEFGEWDLPIFGPTSDAAEIEGSKAHAKELMRECGIPTAPWQTFYYYESALAHIRERPLPMVVKASKLAQGKGSFVCRTREEAESALGEVRALYRGGRVVVVIEDCLFGRELSIHALYDGITTLMLPESQDHKALHVNPDGSTGPNTGGMGAFSPVPWVTPVMTEQIQQVVVDRALERLARSARPFCGCLYPGLMVFPDGRFFVLEYNARFGDPEAQVLMRRLRSPLSEILKACCAGTLHRISSPIWDPRPCVCVVVAVRGYPGAYKSGVDELPRMLIDGLTEARDAAPGIEISHAGTVEEGGRYYTNGGRVLGITAVADTLSQAREHANAAAERIRFDGGREQVYFRRDIGAEASVS
ncbi:MAG: phosphoribosylamine--glycine ligase [Patescibacteria group bacterium]